MDVTAGDWFDGLLACVACGNPDLSRTPEAYACTACHAQYPVSHGVPLLLAPSAYTDAAKVLAGQLGLASPEPVERVFGAALRYRLADTNLRTEFSNIVERYAGLFPETRTAKDAASTKPFELMAHYFNPRFCAGEKSYRSFRLKNTSTKTWATTGTQPFNLSYFLTSDRRPRTPIEGVRSALPIPLRPGHELTIPLRIIAPEKAGRYRIAVKLVQEHVGWLEPAVFESEIEVSSEPIRRPDLVAPPHEGFFDFEGDLRQCGAVLRRAVSLLREGGLTRPLRVLEVACGNDPQTLRHYQPGTQVVACDIALPQVQFGSLQYASGGPAGVPCENFRFVSANVYEPPFKPGAFDLVVVCAALHHFADVTDALRRLSALLQRDGLVVLLREPCKVYPEDGMYIQELLNGFNEQQFELAEYDQMFAGSGLSRSYEQVDYECSYKVVLRKHA